MKKSRLVKMSSLLITALLLSGCAFEIDFTNFPNIEVIDNRASQEESKGSESEESESESHSQEESTSEDPSSGDSESTSESTSESESESESISEESSSEDTSSSESSEEEREYSEESDTIEEEEKEDLTVLYEAFETQYSNFTLENNCFISNDVNVEFGTKNQLDIDLGGMISDTTVYYPPFRRSFYDQDFFYTYSPMGSSRNQIMIHKEDKDINPYFDVIINSGLFNLDDKVYSFILPYAANESARFASQVSMANDKSPFFSNHVTEKPELAGLKYQNETFGIYSLTRQYFENRSDKFLHTSDVSGNKFESLDASVINDMKDIVFPLFKNMEGTYHYSRVTIEINPDEKNSLRFRLYVDEQDIDKLDDLSKDPTKDNWYLLLAECVCYNVDSTDFHPLDTVLGKVATNEKE